MEIIVNNSNPKAAEAISKEPEMVHKFYIENNKLFAKMMEQPNDVMLAQFDNVINVTGREKIHCKFISDKIKVKIR